MIWQSFILMRKDWISLRFKYWMGFFSWWLSWRTFWRSLSINTNLILKTKSNIFLRSKWLIFMQFEIWITFRTRGKFFLIWIRHNSAFLISFSLLNSMYFDSLLRSIAHNYSKFEKWNLFLLIYFYLTRIFWCQQVTSIYTI